MCGDCLRARGLLRRARGLVRHAWGLSWQLGVIVCGDWYGTRGDCQRAWTVPASLRGFRGSVRRKCNARQICRALKPFAGEVQSDSREVAKNAIEHIPEIGRFAVWVVENYGRGVERNVVRQSMPAIFPARYDPK